MRKSRKPVIAPKCDWCGENNQYFIVTGNKLTFCREQVVGYPATKDCHAEYLKEKSNVRKEKEEQKQRLQDQVKNKLQEKEKVIAKFDAFLSELRRKSYEKKI